MLRRRSSSNAADISCRCPSVEATAVASTVLSAALEVCREHRSDYPPAAAAIQLALQAHLQFLSTGGCDVLHNMNDIPHYVDCNVGHGITV